MPILKIWDSANGQWIPVETPGFSTVKIGDVYIDADGATDTIEFQAGENVSLQPSEAYDSVVISVPTVGDLSALKTATKATVVDSINEVAQKASDHGYYHSQLVSSKTWTITHNLNRWPSVTVVDSGGSVVVGDVQYVNQNSITLSFTAEFSGKAYIN